MKKKNNNFAIKVIAFVFTVMIAEVFVFTVTDAEGPNKNQALKVKS